jgi:hypothetical protein
MPNKLKLLVLDDHPQNEDRNKRHLQKGLQAAQVDAAFEKLDDDGAALLAVIGGATPEQEDPFALVAQLSIYSDIDVLFIDQRWFALKGLEWLKGETVAAYLRMFAGIPFVAVVNKFETHDFDLKMTDESSGIADMYINPSLLDRPGLWSLEATRTTFDGDRTPGFRPWMWPEIPRAKADFLICLDEVQALSLDEPILEFFGFNPARAKRLSRAALGCLNPASDEPEKATFKDFLTHGCTGIEQALREKLVERISEAAVRRAANLLLVGELRRWLVWMVLAPQDTLADAPHLAKRMPWLIQGDLNDVSVWNASVTFTGRGSLDPVVEGHRFEKPHWLSREAYWVHNLRSDATADRLYDEFRGEPEADYVFLEDFSTFVPAVEAEEFTANFASAWATRFISKQSLKSGAVRYAPKVNLD